MITTGNEPIELPPRTDPPSRLEGREGLLWLAAAGVMLFTGVLKGINLVIVLAYGLIGLWAVNLFLARRALRGLSARRPAHPPVMAGLPAEWAIDIFDAGPAGGNWALTERVGEREFSWLVLRTGPGQMRAYARGTIERRGRYIIAPLTGRSSFPFGLWTWTVELLPADELIVLPRPARVDGERLRSWMFNRLAGSDVDRRAIRRVVDREAEIHGLRDYRPGDPPRRIHWKASARRNRLTVREYEDAAPPRLLVVVDPWLPGTPDNRSIQLLETAISIAAGVVREWRRAAGARLAIVIAGPTPFVLDGPPGPGLTTQMLTALAVEPGGEPGDITNALGELSRTARSCPGLVISTRQNSPLAGSLANATGRTPSVVWAGQLESWFQLENPASPATAVEK